MTSLQSPNERFQVRIELLEGGSGSFKGIIDEPNQGQVPSYQFTSPRRLLRVNIDHPLKIGAVIRVPSTMVFMVGTLGNSEGIFKSYRLFEATGKYSWTERRTELDVVTKLPREDQPYEMGEIWGAYEPAPEVFDRQVRTSFETGRFITNRPIKLEDAIMGRRVIRVDDLLGLKIATLG